MLFTYDDLKTDLRVLRESLLCDDNVIDQANDLGYKDVRMSTDTYYYPHDYSPKGFGHAVKVSYRPFYNRRETGFVLDIGKRYLWNAHDRDFDEKPFAYRTRLIFFCQRNTDEIHCLRFPVFKVEGWKEYFTADDIPDGLDNGHKSPMGTYVPISSFIRFNLHLPHEIFNIGYSPEALPDALKIVADVVGYEHSRVEKAIQKEPIDIKVDNLALPGD